MLNILFILILGFSISCTDNSFEIPDPVPGGGTEQPNPEPTPEPEPEPTPEPEPEPEPTPEPEPEPEPEPTGKVDLSKWPLVSAAPGRLIADGNDSSTYSLITGSGYNYECPDRSGSHSQAPTRHIYQSYSEWLQRNIFEFHIHAAIDDDRGLTNVTDRQRNEIKTDSKSPSSMVAQEGETLEMRWKFSLPKGMITTDKFCHIHQLKGIDNSEGTADVGMPLITFTARSVSKGQQFQVIFVPPTEQGGGNQYLAKVDLKDFLGEWVAVTERVTFSNSGKYELVITRLSDGKELVRVSDTGRKFWRTGTTGLRPKWGIYRSVGTNGSLRSTLRDEVLLFADFEIEKL